ncbi:MAG: galactose-1-phosphate uridylyltransferase [Candidatus Eisenbacteria bacterium]|nr:galactose-1-phosphate uridylyltransferase [Candidatus Eisenbacteria bacterium]
MPELRRDPVIGRWVIIASGRASRPKDFEHAVPRTLDNDCPFCGGQEVQTPPETFALRPAEGRPDGPGWQVRVVSNKYPALQIEGQLQRRGEGIYDKMNGIGAHEVVIESPDHHAELSDLSAEQIRQVLVAYRTRMQDLSGDRRFRYIQVFKNHGEAAGATLAHPHTQLIAMPIVPRSILDELSGCQQHYELKERCIFCDIIHQELGEGRRIVAENENFVSLAPFAPRFAYETWLLPKAHQSSFERIPDEHLDGLARAMRETLQRIHRLLERPAYNFVIHTSPCNVGRGAQPYHWHFEIMPKLTQVAGFEWGTGFYINPVAPEEAAAALREIDL